MTISTKYNGGDTIHFMINNKASKSVIRGFKIEACMFQEPVEIIYLCNSDENERIHIKVKESEAYLSKEELLKSL